VSLEGAVVTLDRKAEEALHGSGVDRETVVNGKVAVPESARDLVAKIRRYTEGQKSARKASGE